MIWMRERRREKAKFIKSFIIREMVYVENQVTRNFLLS
jgi:hypothetical protein